VDDRSRARHRAAEHPLEPDARQMRAMGQAALDLATEFVEGIPEMPNDLDGALEAAARLREPAPEHGRPMDEVLEVVRLGAMKSYNTSGPGMFGYVPGSGLYTSAIAAFLAAATNRYVTLWSAAPVYAQIETTVVRWLADLVGYPESARGVLTSGGTTSVFSGLITARVTKLGEDLTGGVLYLTGETHHAAVKSALLAGLPRSAVRVVPTTDDLTMDVDALDRLVARDRAAGLRPFCVVASAGTTNTGAVDPLRRIAEVCRRHDLWLHVDGAYGGAFLLTERGRAAMSGIELADSVTLDPHKGFFLPYGTGALLVRDGRLLRDAHNLDAAYLQDVAEESEIPNIAEYSAELSRDFRGLRLWLPVQLHGLGAFRDALDEKLDLARRVYDELSTVAGLELPWQPSLSIVAFRFVPPDPTAPLTTAAASTAGAHGVADTADADAATLRLLDRINESGRIFLSSTTIDGAVHLRICVLSFRTHADRVAEAVEIVRKAVAELS
jgi:aromatic-L-amino-acid/L-tryptophan decarboxylase